MRRRTDPPIPQPRYPAPPANCLRTLHMAGYMMYGMGFPLPSADASIDLRDGWKEGEREAQDYASVC